jgi:hypothetical protein
MADSNRHQYIIGHRKYLSWFFFM